MALNIKSERVERLADELSKLTGESKTAAILRALEERKARLAAGASAAGKLPRVLEFLEKEIWPTVPSRLLGRQISRAERERILGYGKEGV